MKKSTKISKILFNYAFSSSITSRLPLSKRLENFKSPHTKDPPECFYDLPPIDA